MKFGSEFSFVTEKVLYPIMGETPFLYAGSSNGLKVLQLLGFKTFSPFFNETYDSISDPQSRMDSLVEEFVRLTSLRSTGFDTALSDQVRHNCEHFTGVTFRHTLSRFALDILDYSLVAASK
jgi:hypothetical protein